MSYIFQAGILVKLCIVMLAWLSVRSWSTGIYLFLTLRKIRGKFNLTDVSSRDSSRKMCPYKLSIATHTYQKQLSTLSMVAKISPYVGLVGTVLGVMNSISALSHHSTLTLALVGPGISEALITTALGLCVAIPSTVWHEINQTILYECEDFIALRMTPQ